MAWTYPIDTAVPPGSADPKTLDTIIQEHKKGWQETLNVDHYFPLTGTQISDLDAGEHRKVTFNSQIADPTNEADKGWLYIKDVSGKAELHWMDEDGNIKPITKAGGALNVLASEVLLANDTYFTAVDNAGTGTVDLIKANTSDEAVLGVVTTLPDTSKMASSAAPLADAQIANKKYVDDSSPSKYTSSWTSVGVADTNVFTHSLGSDAVNIIVQFKDTGNEFGLGTDRVYQQNTNLSAGAEYGPSINHITSTQVTIQAGLDSTANTYLTNGVAVQATGGEYRVIVTLLV